MRSVNYSISAILGVYSNRYFFIFLLFLARAANAGSELFELMYISHS